MFELRSLFFKLKYSSRGREQLYNLVHERDSRLCNNLYVNGVQAASRSSMNLVYPGAAARTCATGHVECHSRDQPRHSLCLCELPYSASGT